MSQVKELNKQVEELQARLEEMERIKSELEVKLEEKAKAKGQDGPIDKIRARFKDDLASATAEEVIYNPLAKTADIEDALRKRNFKPRSGYIACVRATVGLMLREEFLADEVVKHYEGQ